MATPKDNVMSLGHLTGIDIDYFNIFLNQREQSLKKRSVVLQDDFSTQRHQHLSVMLLQQRWQELKDRECAARRNNRQLLQQFDTAQETLREMVARTAAMKTIRMEYERYLDQNSPRWQQQLKEKTKAAQRKKMDEYLSICLKNTEEQETKSSVEQPLLSQGSTKGPQKVAAPLTHRGQKNSLSDSSQHCASHLYHMNPSWLTQSQSQKATFPKRVLQGSSQISPFLLPHSHPLQLQQLAATHGHHQRCPMQSPPGWASGQHEYPCSWASGAAGIPSGHDALYMGESLLERGVAQVVAEETSRRSSSNRMKGGSSRESHFSQELDIKPVRLSSGHAESSESGGDSSQVRREKKKKKRGRAQRTSLERERCSSQKSSRASSDVIIASATVAQTYESEASSEKDSTSSRRTKRRIRASAVDSPMIGKAAKERNTREGNDKECHSEESQSTCEESVGPLEEPTSENVVNQSPLNDSESCSDESASQVEESVSIQLDNRVADELEEREGSSSQQSSAGEQFVGHDEQFGDGEEDDGGKEKQEKDVEDNEVLARKSTTDEEEDTSVEDEIEESDEDQGDDEELSDKLKNEVGKNSKQDSASSQDEESQEDESEGSEDKVEEDDEGSDEEGDGGGEECGEQRSNRAEKTEEERDSEDSIISPQEKRPKKIHVIPEEISEDDDGKEGSKTGASNEESDDSDDEDIENLLAPQAQTTQRNEKELQLEVKPKALCSNVKIFQVELDKSADGDHQSDSDEFDHFYD